MSAASSSPAPAFQAGGFVREEMLYIERPADSELPEALRAGEFCYVLAPRQIGKTSLAVRTRKQLAEAGFRCVSVDLNAIGSHISAEGWFYSLLYSVAEGLDLEDQVEPFWEAHAKQSLPLRWSRFCRHVLLEQVKSPLVIFLDEIDSLLSVADVADDFFASLRAMHEQRGEDPELSRLTFCLLGAAAPRELMRDERRTPFNIGRSIHLEDFTRTEAERLLPGLAGLGHEPKALLEALLAWTDGHPYMTLKVAQALAAQGPGAPGAADALARVDACVQRLFLDNGRQLEANLSYAEERFSRGKRGEQVPKMLRLYRRLLAGEQVAAVGGDPVQQEFRLTGMVAERREGAGRWLRVRNRVFATVFNEAWVRAKEADRIVAGPLDAWLARGRSQDLLLRGALLEQAQQWARSRDDLTREEQQFLEASRELAAKTRSRRVLVGVLVQKNQEAVEARNLAVQEQNKAEEERTGAKRAQVLAEQESKRASDAETASQRIAEELRQKNQETTAALAAAKRADAKSRESSRSLMKATARLSAELGQRQGSGAAAFEAALSTLVIAQQLQVPEPPDAFVGIAGGVSELAGPRFLRGHGGGVTSAVFSPDGKRVLTASWNDTARLWDGISGQLLATLQGHEEEVNSAVFSPDGSRVLTTSDDETARLWDSTSGRLLAIFRGHERDIESAAFSPDGKRVITASEDHTARQWIAYPEGWLIEACNLPQIGRLSAEIRAFCQPYKGRTP